MWTATIDLGPISSIAYARNHRQLLLSRRLSISSSGAVDSIQLVAHRPLSEIRSVALTRQSATSVSLLKTILRLRFGREVRYGELSGSVAEALQEYDAALLIGDQGLEALYSCRPPTTCHDLGALWQEWTGLPMVYAVWAAREDFAGTNGPELLAVEEELVTCMHYGREHLAEVVDCSLGAVRFDRPSLTRYFAVLRYDFTDEYRRGLTPVLRVGASKPGNSRRCPSCASSTSWPKPAWATSPDLTGRRTAGPDSDRPSGRTRRDGVGSGPPSAGPAVDTGEAAAS